MSMKKAINSAKQGINKGEGGPFGACIVDKKGKVIAVSHNKVWKNCNPTSHAEVNVIGMATKKLKTIDLSGCTIYSTNEPCPMCFGAIHWAKIDKVVFGTSIDDAAKYGFNELKVSNFTLKKMGKLKKPILEQDLEYYQECVSLFKEWKKLKGKSY